jgi:serine phosphatase RsbU (regulator of sigma subunit)
MGKGDIMLIYSDGLADLKNETAYFLPARLEETLRSAKHLSATEICREIKEAIAAFGTSDDDITFVVVKKS